MPGLKRSRVQTEESRAKIARWYLEGQTQAEIGRKLGLTQQQISLDLKAIRKQWLDSALRDFDEARAQELAKIDRLEATYWESWQRSLEPTQTKTQYIRAGEGGQPAPERATLHTAPGTGDPRWLQGVQWCIDRRCKLLGLDAPEKHEHGFTFDVEAWKREAQARLQQASETMQLFEDADEGD
jgi:hypothetical protein